MVLAQWCGLGVVGGDGGWKEGLLVLPDPALAHQVHRQLLWEAHPQIMAKEIFSTNATTMVIIMTITATSTCMLPHTSMTVSSAQLNFWGWMSGAIGQTTPGSEGQGGGPGTAGPL